MVSVARNGGGWRERQFGAGYSRHRGRGGCLGLVWLGDALIYVVLPLYPAVFGVETAAIAILLSANRVIRILGYGWVSPLARRFGANTLTAAACAAARALNACLRPHDRLRAAVRRAAVWGGAYGVINLTNTAYAYGDGTTAGMRIGLNRAVSTLGPVLALGARRLAGDAGSARRTCSSSMGWSASSRCRSRCRCRACAIPSATRRRSPPSGAGRRARSTCCSSWSRSAPTACSPRRCRLLLADIIPVTSALIGAGLLLAAQRLVSTSILALDRRTAGRPLRRAADAHPVRPSRSR